MHLKMIWLMVGLVSLNALAGEMVDPTLYTQRSWIARSFLKFEEKICSNAAGGSKAIELVDGLPKGVETYGEFIAHYARDSRASSSVDVSSMNRSDGFFHFIANTSLNDSSLDIFEREKIKVLEEVITVGLLLNGRAEVFAAELQRTREKRDLLENRSGPLVDKLLHHIRQLVQSVLDAELTIARLEAESIQENYAADSEDVRSPINKFKLSNAARRKIKTIRRQIELVRTTESILMSPERYAIIKRMVSESRPEQDLKRVWAEGLLEKETLLQQELRKIHQVQALLKQDPLALYAEETRGFVASQFDSPEFLSIGYRTTTLVKLDGSQALITTLSLDDGWTAAAKCRLMARAQEQVGVGSVQAGLVAAGATVVAPAALAAIPSLSAYAYRFYALGTALGVALNAKEIESIHDKCSALSRSALLVDDESGSALSRLNRCEEEEMQQVALTGLNLVLGASLHRVSKFRPLPGKPKDWKFKGAPGVAQSGSEDGVIVPRAALKAPSPSVPQND